MSNDTLPVINVGDVIIVDPGRGHAYGLKVTAVHATGWVSGKRVIVDGAPSRKWIGDTTPFRPDAVRSVTIVSSAVK